MMDAYYVTLMDVIYSILLQLTEGADMIKRKGEKICTDAFRRSDLLRTLEFDEAVISI